jgi:hypothetical protein
VAGALVQAVVVSAPKVGVVVPVASAEAPLNVPSVMVMVVVAMHASMAVFSFAVVMVPGLDRGRKSEPRNGNSGNHGQTKQRKE